MAVQPYVIQRQKEQKEKDRDPLDLILQGLQVANAGFGIASNYQNIQNAKEQRVLAQQQQKMNEFKLAEAKDATDTKTRISKGEYTPGEIDEMVSSGKIQVGKADTPGAQKRFITFPGEDRKEEIFILPKTQGAAGKPTSLTKAEVVDPKSGIKYAATFNPETGEYKKTDIVVDVPKPKETKNYDADPKEARTELRQSQNEFNKINKETRVALENVKEAKSYTQAAINNKTAAQQLAIRLGRAAGEVGAFTEADRANYGGSAALSDKISNWASLSSSGTITPQIAAEIDEFLALIEQRKLENLQEQGNLITSQYTEIYGGDPQVNFRKITGQKSAQSQAQNNKTPPNLGAPKLSSEDSEALKAFRSMDPSNPNYSKMKGILEMKGLLKPQKAPARQFSRPTSGQMG